MGGWVDGWMERWMAGGGGGFVLDQPDKQGPTNFRPVLNNQKKTSPEC
jgi:hypothetical protein